MTPLLTDFLQRQRLRVVSPYLKGSVLDLGCGNAKIVALLRIDQSYVGVDGRLDMIGWLKDNYARYAFYHRDLDQEVLALSGQFDTILMMAVIEHLADPGRVLSQLPHYLKPEGQLIITTPSPLGNKIHQVGARFGVFSIEATREHKIIFDYRALRARLERNGLQITHYRRFLLGGNQLFVCEVAR